MIKIQWLLLACMLAQLGFAFYYNNIVEDVLKSNHCLLWAILHLQILIALGVDKL